MKVRNTFLIVIFCLAGCGKNSDSTSQALSDAGVQCRLEAPVTLSGNPLEHQLEFDHIRLEPELTVRDEVWPSADLKIALFNIHHGYGWSDEAPTDFLGFWIDNQRLHSSRGFANGYIGNFRVRSEESTANGLHHVHTVEPADEDRKYPGSALDLYMQDNRIVSMSFEVEGKSYCVRSLIEKPADSK